MWPLVFSRIPLPFVDIFHGFAGKKRTAGRIQGADCFEIFTQNLHLEISFVSLVFSLRSVWSLRKKWRWIWIWMGGNSQKNWTRYPDPQGLISNFLFECISGKSEHLTFFPLLVSALSNLVYTITERRFCKRHISIFAKMGNKSTAVFREKIFREINLTKNVFPIQNLSPIYWYFAVFPHKISRTFLPSSQAIPKWMKAIWPRLSKLRF